MGTKRFRILFVFLGLMLCSDSRAESRIVFIVNRDNPATQISARDLVDFYEKKKRFWPDETPIRWVDRIPGSPERDAFLKDIIKQSESSIDMYWYGQKLHSGDSIPLQVRSDEMVIEFVKSFKGAIGYVSSTTRLSGEPVKPIKVTGRAGD
jgi:ABC-type phosphate transport system substrate-binding protein